MKQIASNFKDLEQKQSICYYYYFSGSDQIQMVKIPEQRCKRQIRSDNKTHRSKHLQPNEKKKEIINSGGYGCKLVK